MKIDSYEKLVAMLVLQVANLPTYKNKVGATEADMTAVTQELDLLQFLDETSGVVDADKKTLIRIKQKAYNGEIDEEIEPFPVFPVITSPVPLIAGCLERANRRNKRFKAADGYTKAIGIALGIEEEATDESPAEIVPTLEGFPAKSGYHAAIVISNRGKSNMWKIFGRRAGVPKWLEIASGTGKSGNFTLEPSEPNKPEQIEVKVQLYKGNEPYGAESDTIYITLNP